MEAKMLYDADFVIEAFKRYQKQCSGRAILILVRYIAALMFSTAGIFLMLQGDILVGFGALMLAVFSLGSPAIEYWLIRRRMKKSPFFGDELTITFSDDGFHAESSIQDVRFKWCVFTRVTHFKDGYLLFQGDKMFSWIPFSSIDSQAISPLDELLRANIKEHKVAEQVGAHQPTTRVESKP